MKKFLAIDTSSEKGMVALLEGTNQLDIRLCGMRLFGTQANPLMSEMQLLFEEQGWQPDSMDCIVAGVGPGSYTGIRVGCMVAKTLSFAKKIPLVGIPSLLAWAPQEAGPFAIAVDAKVGGLYLLFGEVATDGSLSHGECVVHPLQEAINKLMDVPRIQTPHKGLIQKRLSTMQPPVDVNRWQWHECAPNPEMMVRFAMNEIENGGGNQEGELSLLYLRKTQAEIEREERERKDNSCQL